MFLRWSVDGASRKQRQAGAAAGCEIFGPARTAAGGRNSEQRRRVPSKDRALQERVPAARGAHRRERGAAASPGPVRAVDNAVRPEGLHQPAYDRRRLERYLGVYVRKRREELDRLAHLEEARMPGDEAHRWKGPGEFPRVGYRAERGVLPVRLGAMEVRCVPAVEEHRKAEGGETLHSLQRAPVGKGGALYDGVELEAPCARGHVAFQAAGRVLRRVVEPGERDEPPLAPVRPGQIVEVHVRRNGHYRGIVDSVLVHGARHVLERRGGVARLFRVHHPALEKPLDGAVKADVAVQHGLGDRDGVEDTPFHHPRPFDKGPSSLAQYVAEVRVRVDDHERLIRGRSGTSRRPPERRRRARAFRFFWRRCPRSPAASGRGRRSRTSLSRRRSAWARGSRGRTGA